MVDVRQRLWASACATNSELHARLRWPNPPAGELEIMFNGGIAPDVARHYADVLTGGELPDEATILDLGCGFGRVAMALTQVLGPEQRYVGLDPNVDGIAWAASNIAPRFPNFSFQRVDIRSGPYNPTGTIDGREFRFPFPDGSLDLVFMISVLTHVDLATVENYVREAARTLKPDTGRLVGTIFLMDEEVDRLLASGQGHFRMAEVHGPSRVENAANPELAIAHPRQEVLDLLDRAGFRQHTVFDGFWSGREGATPMDFQDLLIADRGDGTVLPRPAQPNELAPELDRREQEVCDRISAMAVGDSWAASFLTWCYEVTLNAFWWQGAGLEVGRADDELAAGDPGDLRFDALRRLGLEDLGPEGAADGTYLPLDDAATGALLVSAGRVVRRETLMACFLEAAGNGLRILDAAAAGEDLVLRHRETGRVAMPAPISAFAG